MKAAIDLCIRPRSEEALAEIVGIASKLGYRALAVEEAPGLRLTSLTSIGRDYGVEIYTRITIRPGSKRELLSMLARIGGKYDIIAVRSKEPEVLRHAARDGRVGIVSLSPGQARYMDKSEASLLRQGGGVVEAWFSELIGAVERGDPRVVRGFEALVRRAVGFNARIVLSSCARTRWDVRSPRVFVSLLVSLGVPLPVAKNIVYVYPLSVLS